MLFQCGRKASVFAGSSPLNRCTRLLQVRRAKIYGEKRPIHDRHLQSIERAEIQETATRPDRHNCSCSHSRPIGGLAADAAFIATVCDATPRPETAGKLPELGRWDGKSLTSLAPWSRDSGQKRGNRSIQGGRGMVQRALYICAWALLRIDGDLRDFYQRLRGRGKPGKVTVIAVARKLLMQLNAVARRGTAWVKQHASNRVPLHAAQAWHLTLR